MSPSAAARYSSGSAQTGDPNQLGDVREDVPVVIALLARDFGRRHLLAPTRHYLAELADKGLHPTHVDRAILDACEAGLLHIVPAIEQDGRPAREAIVEVVGDREVGADPPQPPDRASSRRRAGLVARVTGSAGLACAAWGAPGLGAAHGPRARR